MEAEREKRGAPFYCGSKPRQTQKSEIARKKKKKKKRPTLNENLADHLSQKKTARRQNEAHLQTLREHRCAELLYVYVRVPICEFTAFILSPHQTEGVFFGAPLSMGDRSASRPLGAPAEKEASANELSRR